MFSKDINLDDLISGTIEVFEKNYGSEEFNKVDSEIDIILDNYIEEYGRKKLNKRIFKSGGKYISKSGFYGLKAIHAYNKGEEDKAEKYINESAENRLKYMALTYLSGKIHVKLLEDGKYSNLKKKLMKRVLKKVDKKIENIENPKDMEEYNCKEFMYPKAAKAYKIADFIAYAYTQNIVPEFKKLLYS